MSIEDLPDEGADTMTWFKVDDGLHAHLKARRAIRKSPSSMSLWVLAGSWCSSQLTNGWLPEDIAESIMPKTWRRDAAALVEVGLWRVEERDGEPGWKFHGWNKPGRQPTREQVLADRQAAADRQQRARDRARESRAPSRRDSHASHNGSNGPPDPTRPDLEEQHPPAVPPRDQRAATAGDARRGTRLPDDFLVTDAMKTWAREHTPLCGTRDHEMFMNHWLAQTGHRAVKRDWLRTWRNWMYRAQDNYERRGGRPRSTTDERVAGALEAGRRLQAIHDQQAVGQ